MIVKKILVFAPHPDDDLIGCGGSITKHVWNGNKVSVVYITNGDAENLKYTQEEFTRLRKKETVKAAEVIGVEFNDLVFMDEIVWEIKQDVLRRKLLKLVRQLKPDICYIPHADDNHVDHRIVNRVALDAISMASGPWFKEYGKKEDSWEVSLVLCYEVWTPLTEFLHVENITKFIKKKSDALLQHKSQISNKKYHEGIRGLNRYRGAMTGKGRYCECFQIAKTNKAF